MTTLSMLTSSGRSERFPTASKTALDLAISASVLVAMSFGVKFQYNLHPGTSGPHPGPAPLLATGDMITRAECGGSLRFSRVFTLSSLEFDFGINLE